MNKNSLKDAVADTYRTGRTIKKLPVETIAKAIRYSHDVADKLGSIDEAKSFANWIINLPRKDHDDIYYLLKIMDDYLRTSEPSSFYAEAATNILYTCRENRINVKDFGRLMKLVSRLDNGSSSSVNDYIDLLNLTRATIEKIGVSIHTMIGIASTLDEHCNYFDDNTTTRINEGIVNFAKLYKDYGITKDLFLIRLSAIAENNRCNDISEFVAMMEDKLKSMFNKNMVINYLDIDEIRNSAGGREKNKESSLERRVATEINIGDYKPIALEQAYSLDKGNVRVSAVPFVHTVNQGIYILTLLDEKKTLDCIYRGSPLEATLLHNKMEYVMEQNKNAMIKKKVTAYGRLLEDKTLLLDSIITDETGRQK
jgi:hypothetical protein